MLELSKLKCSFIILQMRVKLTCWLSGHIVKYNILRIFFTYRYFSFRHGIRDPLKLW